MKNSQRISDDVFKLKELVIFATLAVAQNEVTGFWTVKYGTIPFLKLTAKVLKISLPPKKGLSSNHPFAGDMLGGFRSVFFRLIRSHFGPAQ